ncbi:hypothetical protein ACFL03_08075 [Thermodesulfobacteriota bacterium]
MIFVLYLVAAPAEAIDLIRGTVVSVEHRTGSLILLDADTSGHITVVIRSGRLPGTVAAGSEVRVWGRYMQDQPSVFQAQKIIQERPRRREKDSDGVKSRRREKDPTGVRSRLFQ